MVKSSQDYQRPAVTTRYVLQSTVNEAKHWNIQTVLKNHLSSFVNSTDIQIAIILSNMWYLLFCKIQFSICLYCFCLHTEFSLIFWDVNFTSLITSLLFVNISSSKETRFWSKIWKKCYTGNSLLTVSVLEVNGWICWQLIKEYI